MVKFTLGLLVFLTYSLIRRPNSMHTSQLVGQSVEIKVAGLSSSIFAVILGVEAAGLWIHEGDVGEKIATDHQGRASSGSPKDPAVFVPFATISWLMTAMKESLYQKAR